MANHFLVSVDLDKDLKIGFNAETATESSFTLRGLDLRTISFLNEVHIRVTPQNYVLALSFVQRNFNHLTTFCDVTNLTKITDVISLLDIGVAKAFVSQSQFKSIATNRLLDDIERLVVSLDHAVDNCDLACKTSQTEKGTNVVIDSVFVAYQTYNMDQQWLLDDVQKTSQLCQSGHCQYVTLLDHSIESYVRTLQAGYVPIIPASFLTMDPDNQPHLIPVHSLIVAALHSDRADGLFPTVVADERGTCLGLVYSNENSIESALRLGKGVYHSRSRNGLWIKGLESGDTQQLISVGLDCDADTLRFTVRQNGDGEYKLLISK